ncbi:MAG TPA: hypothetical protein VNK89_11875 [Thermoflexus sp.]|nr:hypothetical protein [Thermoflexus sp.]
MSGKRRYEAHRWFQQARYDLEAVRWNVEGGFYATACFLTFIPPSHDPWL